MWRLGKSNGMAWVLKAVRVLIFGPPSMTATSTPVDGPDARKACRPRRPSRRRTHRKSYLALERNQHIIPFIIEAWLIFLLVIARFGESGGECVRRKRSTRAIWSRGLLSGVTRIAGTPKPAVSLARLVFNADKSVGGAASVNFDGLLLGPFTGTCDQVRLHHVLEPARATPAVSNTSAAPSRRAETG